MFYLNSTTEMMLGYNKRVYFFHLVLRNDAGALLTRQ